MWSLSTSGRPPNGKTVTFHLGGASRLRFSYMVVDCLREPRALPHPSGRFSPSVVPFLRGVFVCLTRPLARIKHEVKGFPSSVYSSLGRGVRWSRGVGVTPVPMP